MGPIKKTGITSNWISYSFFSKSGYFFFFFGTSKEFKVQTCEEGPHEGSSAVFCSDSQSMHLLHGNTSEHWGYSQDEQILSMI